jgi:hypothetical protein
VTAETHADAAGRANALASFATTARVGRRSGAEDGLQRRDPEIRLVPSQADLVIERLQDVLGADDLLAARLFLARRDEAGVDGARGTGREIDRQRASSVPPKGRVSQDE